MSTYISPTATPHIIFYMYIKIMSGPTGPKETILTIDKVYGTFDIERNSGETDSLYHAVADSLISGLYEHTNPPLHAIHAKLRKILESFMSNPDRIVGLAPTAERLQILVDGYKQNGQFKDTDESLRGVILLAGLLNTNLLLFTQTSTDGQVSYTRQPLVSMKNNENEYTVCIHRFIADDVPHFDALIPKTLIMTPVDPYGKFTLPFLEEHGASIRTVPEINKATFEEIFPFFKSLFNGICALDSHRVVNYGNLPEQFVYIEETHNFKLRSTTPDWPISPFSYKFLENDVNRPVDAARDADFATLLSFQHLTAPCEFAALGQLMLTGSANTEVAKKNFRLLMDNVKPMFDGLKGDRQLHSLIRAELTEIENLAEVEPGNQILANKIDVYMLGATVLMIMQVCYTLHPHSPTYESNDFYQEVFELCKRMLRYNPVDRLSSVDANRIYTKILTDLEP